MIQKDREKEIKTILSRLERLVLMAEKEKKEYEEYKDSDDHIDMAHMYEVADAYEQGIFHAYAIVKNIVEGDYE